MSDSKTPRTDAVKKECKERIERVQSHRSFLKSVNDSVVKLFRHSEELETELNEAISIIQNLHLEFNEYIENEEQSNAIESAENNLKKHGMIK